MFCRKEIDRMPQEKTCLNRRQFLKATAAGIALTLSGKPRFVVAQEKYDLAVISGDPASATRKALEVMGGISRFVKKGQKVVLKPNMSFPRPPEAGSNTHPEVVVAVAKACMEAGASQVLVLDYTLGRPEPCLERSGIRDACKSLKNVYVLAPHEKKFFKEIQVPQGKAMDRIEVIRDVLECDVLISIPVAKSHSATGISMGTKGLMGLIWDRKSFHDKYNINEAIADMASVIKPHLTILDATRALTSGGPAGPGEVVKPNLVIAGTDPVAVDSYGVTVAPWYGQHFKGRQVEHLVAAHQRGLGEIDSDRLKIFKGKA
jgi:uncharacterized protein (DUF362 family)